MIGLLFEVVSRYANVALFPFNMYFVVIILVN